MKQSLNTYRIIAIISFLILACVQFYLVWNTYQLTNERYYYAEKGILREKYGLSVRNDKVFPGGRRIIDSMLNPKLYYMDSLRQFAPAKLHPYVGKLTDSIFHELIRKENIGQLIQEVKKTNNITDSLEYALRIDDLHIVLSDVKYLSVYNKKSISPYISKSIQSPTGILVGGNLQDLNSQNQVSAFTVSSPEAFNYGVTFTLYVDTVKRNMEIVRRMLLTLSLSLGSILIMLVLFFFTFRNWLRQKKLAEMKSDFINNITHEFHTPLSAIIVANKNLRNERIMEKKENIVSLAEVIARQADRLKRLFNQVLDITLMENRNLDKKEYLLPELIQGIITDYRLKLGDTPVNIIYNNTLKQERVLLDEFYFTTMVMNLFDNAIKYNESAVKELVISTWEEEGHTVLSIQDNGMGMSPKNIRHIFEKFYREKNSYSHPLRGLGLGLFYVKECVDAHGWKISVTSEPGIGSIFTIMIPGK